MFLHYQRVCVVDLTSYLYLIPSGQGKWTWAPFLVPFLSGLLSLMELKTIRHAAKQEIKPCQRLAFFFGTRITFHRYFPCRSSLYFIIFLQRPNNVLIAVLFPRPRHCISPIIRRDNVLQRWLASPAPSPGGTLCFHNGIPTGFIPYM